LLLQVRLGSSFIEQATLEAWRAEASLINEALEELPAQLREQEAARVSRAARLRLSWWDQAVDEGYVYPDAAPAAAAGDEDALGAQQTVGSLLQGLVKQWAADECLRVDTLVRTAVDEHVRAAVAAKQQAAAAAAVAAAVAAAAAAQPSVDNAQLDVTQLVAGEEAAVDVRASLDVEHEEATVQPAGAEAPAATEPSAAASSTTFSLAADGGLDIFNLSACQAERSDGAAAAATAAAPTAPPSAAAAYLPAAALSMADVLSDAMTSLNAATRAAAADVAEDAAISSRLFARGGLDDFSALGGSAGVDDVEDEDDGEPLSGGCDDVDDEAASAALALVSRGAGGGALTRLTLDVKCGGAGAVNPGGAGVTPRGVAAESPGGCPFGGIHLALLPQATDGEEGDEEEAAATGGAGGRVSLAATGAAAAAPASKSSAFSMAALASSLGLDDVGASADADVRSVTSLAGLFGCPPGGAGADDAEGGPASASAAAGAHPGRMSLARVLEEAAAAGAAAAGAQRQSVLVFDKLTGEASMVSVAINGSSAGPSVSPSLPGSDDAHAPEAFAPLAELLPLHAGGGGGGGGGGAGALPPAPLYAARAGGGGSSGGPPGGVVVPIAARVGPFSPARVAAAAAAAVAVAGGAAGTAAQHVSPRLIPAAAAAATVVGCPAATAAAAGGSGAPPAAGQGPAGALASGVSRRLELDAR
jgi:hypothetical protein